jgi:hypothetical protein
MGEIANVTAERDALQAENARLREAIEMARECIITIMMALNIARQNCPPTPPA